MAEQNIYNNSSFDTNPNHFWLTCPPPFFTPSQPITPVYNLNYRTPFIHPNVSPCNKTAQIDQTLLSYNCNTSNLNYYNESIPYNQSIINSPPLPKDIDENYILRYLCPLQLAPKDETNVWIESWLADKERKVTTQGVKLTNFEISEISNKVKECKILLENMNNNKQLLEQYLSTMTETEWKIACSNLVLIKNQLDTSINTLNLDNYYMSKLKLKLAKRKKKRDRMKRIKSNLKIIKSHQKDEIGEINRKIDVWQNTLKEKILNEKLVNETKIEANIVLKGVKGKIDDAKNQLSLFDTLEKLRICRLQNCVNKRKNPLLEESSSKLKLLWKQKLKYYNKEEEELKNMLSKAEAKKHEKREVEIQDKLREWDKILFGPHARSHESNYDNLLTFIDIRRDWDKYVVNENETPACSGIPVGWILPLLPCNSDWEKYSNNVNVL